MSASLEEIEAREGNASVDGVLDVNTLNFNDQTFRVGGVLVQLTPRTIITDDEPADPATADPEWVRETMADAILARAIELMAHRIDEGDWPDMADSDAAGDAALRNDLQRAMKERDAIEGALTKVQTRINELNGIAELQQHGIELPEDADLEEATLVIRDRDGNVMGEWTITSPVDLERSLLSVELDPVDSSGEKD